MTDGTEKTDPASNDVPFGGYVNDPAYLLMRLRMELTGTASPTDAAWGEALGRLLDHLEAHPVPSAAEEPTVPA